MPAKKRATQRPESGRDSSFPWVALLLLAISVYLFWILPRQLPDRPTEVVFEPASGSPGGEPPADRGLSKKPAAQRSGSGGS
jgi:hypothetical protein